MSLKFLFAEKKHFRELGNKSPSAPEETPIPVPSPVLEEKSGPEVTVRPAHSIHGALPTQRIARIDPVSPLGIPPLFPMVSLPHRPSTQPALRTQSSTGQKNKKPSSYSTTKLSKVKPPPPKKLRWSSETNPSVVVPAKKRYKPKDGYTFDAELHPLRRTSLGSQTEKTLKDTGNLVVGRASTRYSRADLEQRDTDGKRFSCTSYQTCFCTKCPCAHHGHNINVRTYCFGNNFQSQTAQFLTKGTDPFLVSEEVSSSGSAEGPHSCPCSEDSHMKNIITHSLM